MNMWKRLSPVKKEIFLLLIMAGFGLVKQFLVYNLPIMAVPKGIHDDWIMVHLADTLRIRGRREKAEGCSWPYGRRPLYCSA